MSSSPSSETFSKGFRLENPTEEELAEALAAATDYRGDITIDLEDGSTLCGYVFNFEAKGADPALTMLLQESDERRRVSTRDIAGIAFSGRDTASGKSWETWVAHYNEKKAARDRGEDVGRIGIDPDPLD